MYDSSFEMEDFIEKIESKKAAHKLKVLNMMTSSLRINRAN